MGDGSAGIADGWVDPEIAHVAVSRMIRGGFAGATRESVEIYADGSFHIARAGADDVSGALSGDQFALLEAVCDSTDFAELPRFVEGPISRSDAYTWTYQVGDREVAMRDPDRAGDAVPSVLRVLDALIEAVERGVPSGDEPGGSP